MPNVKILNSKVEIVPTVQTFLFKFPDIPSLGWVIQMERGGKAKSDKTPASY